MKPRSVARGFALSDGQGLAAKGDAKLHARDLAGALECVEQAKACFEWVARDEEQRVLDGPFREKKPTHNHTSRTLQQHNHSRQGSIFDVATLATVPWHVPCNSAFGEEKKHFSNLEGGLFSHTFWLAPNNCM